MTTFTAHLDRAALRAAFQRDGFAVLPDIVPLEELARMRVLLGELFAQRAGRAAGDEFDLAGVDDDASKPGLPQILSPGEKAPELRGMSILATGMEVAIAGLDLPANEVHFGGDHAILKPAAYGKPTPWHQDEAYWNQPDIDARGISLWLPLQAATIDNGCLWFVPGSHRLEMLPHRPIGGDARVHGLELSVKAPEGGVPVPLAAGSAVAHCSRTLHYAGPNRTAEPRYAYSVGFWAEGIRRATPHLMPWSDRATAREARAKASRPG